MKKGREKADNTNEVFSNEADDKEYKIYKKRCYRNLVVEALLAFVLGSLLRFLLGKL